MQGTEIKFTSELPLTTYWTPDGRELHKLPNNRGTNKGTVRDANLDNGWLLHEPFGSEKQLYCPNCDKWHKTQGLIDECGSVKRANTAKWEQKAKDEQVKKDEVSALKNDVAVLKTDIGDIKSMLSQLLRGK